MRAGECVHGVHAHEFLCVCVCNQVHLHIVFVCRSVNVLSCVDIIQSFTYLSCVIILDVTKDVARQHKKKREAIPTASRRHHKKRRSKQEYLAVARLLLPTSNLLLPQTVYVCMHRCMCLHASLCVHRYILTIIHSCLSLPVQNLHESVSILMKARVTMKMTMMGVREINIRQFKETLKQIQIQSLFINHITM